MVVRSTEKILIVIGSGSRHSASAMLAEKIRQGLTTEREHHARSREFHELYLGQYAMDMADFISDGFPSDDLAEALERVRSASAIIAITPVFNASYSGLFKMFWDMTELGDIARTPTIVAAVGGSWKHSLMVEYSLIPLFRYLQADLVPTGIYTTNTSLNPSAEDSHRTNSRIERATAELSEKLRSLNSTSTS